MLSRYIAQAVFPTDPAVRNSQWESRESTIRALYIAVGAAVGALAKPKDRAIGALMGAGAGLALAVADDATTIHGVDAPTVMAPSKV